jgi:hypothetical protein
VIWGPAVILEGKQALILLIVHLKTTAAIYFVMVDGKIYIARLLQTEGIKYKTPASKS